MSTTSSAPGPHHVSLQLWLSSPASAAEAYLDVVSKNDLNDQQPGRHFNSSFRADVLLG